MKKFVIRTLVFFAIVLPPMYYVNYVVDNGLKKSRMQYFAVWNDIYTSNAKADLVVSGGSRAWMHVSTYALDSILNLNSFNIGIDGWYLPMQVARLKVYLQHNPKPKYILQSVDLLLFYDRSDLFNSEQFLPYLNDTIIRNITSRYVGKFTTPEFHVPLFKYNNQPRLIKQGIFCYYNFGGVAQNALHKGYAGVDLPWNNVFDDLKQHNPNGIKRTIDSNVFKIFDEYVRFCKANDIHLIFTFHPLLREEFNLELNSNLVLDIIKRYSKEYGIPFLDYHDDSICYDRKYFIDYQHLNKIGAEKFSIQLAHDLKNMIR